MRRTIVLALTGTTAMAAAAGGALAVSHAPRANGPEVTLRIEGVKKTLLAPERVRTSSGWITKYGAPRGKCPATSAQGALDMATHGHWKGTWYSQYNEYLITSIRGEKPSGNDFWEIFVNNRPSPKGACALKLHRGDQLLFADTDGKHYPAALTAPERVTAGNSFTVRLLGFAAHGKSKPLAGIKITGNGTQTIKTNSAGQATVTTQRSGKLVLGASPAGYIRTEAVVHVDNRH